MVARNAAMVRSVRRTVRPESCRRLTGEADDQMSSSGGSDHLRNCVHHYRPNRNAVLI